ncbi:hypothetical protein QIU19_02830 [Capnocytophaga canimorsus]|nr:hypothetical protein [Capnocytophaga canimorsus]WGU68878.1 hypothetical protein QIU19_02830 [Capnocytophaga canimorsus]
MEDLKGQIHQVEVFVNEEKIKNENLVQQHILAKQAYDEFKKAIKGFDIEKLISEQNEIIQKIEQQKKHFKFDTKITRGAAKRTTHSTEKTTKKGTTYSN